jgi:hypothetical protein
MKIFIAESPNFSAINGGENDVRINKIANNKSLNKESTVQECDATNVH